ncbi:hypothetical protein MNEG_10557, partial [Monoraphidium neglectum]
MEEPKTEVKQQGGIRWWLCCGAPPGERKPRERKPKRERRVHRRRHRPKSTSATTAPLPPVKVLSTAARSDAHPPSILS